MDDYHKKLLDELPSLGTWHHIIDLGEGIKTSKHQHSGYDPEKRWKLIEPYVPEDLTGKSVLDIGCNSGYLSMKMKKRGAFRVVAVDSFEKAIKQTEFIAKWYNVDLEIIKEDVHAYCLTTDERFDYIIFLGLFYHLKYGTIVLDRLAEMTKSRLFFQTVSIGPQFEDFQPQDNYSLDDRTTMIKSDDFPKMFFIEKKFNNDLSNWWIANQPAIISLIRNAGMKILARPEALYVCEPDKPFGKKVYNKCVFPRYGKADGEILP